MLAINQKNKLFFLVFLLMSSASYADTLEISCGLSVKKGKKSAELTLLDDPEKKLEVYVNGKELQKKEFGVVSREEFWIVTIFGKKGSLDKKYEINLKTQTAQEFSIEGKKIRAAGNPKKCHINSSKEALSGGS